MNSADWWTLFHDFVCQSNIKRRILMNGGSTRQATVVVVDYGKDEVLVDFSTIVPPANPKVSRLILECKDGVTTTALRSYLLGQASFIRRDSKVCFTCEGREVVAVVPIEHTILLAAV